MLSKLKITLLSIILVFSSSIFKSFPQSNNSRDTICVAFWNLENLFDTVDDPKKNDEEFLPEGRKQWTKEKLHEKLEHLAKVISSMNDNKGPDIMGFCEVEHRALIDSMLSEYIQNKNYKIAYAESPDKRGIDNGMIYDSVKFKLLSIKADTVTLPDKYPTRFILNVNLQYRVKDTLVLFVNHWPSRSGGELKSEPNRISAAETLSGQVKKYFMKNSNANIIIMGDFNDEPGNKSILKTLNAHSFSCKSDTGQSDFKQMNNELYNLAYRLYENDEGSYKYHDDWNMLDQMIVSANLLGNKPLRYLCNSFAIYKPSFMITHSGKYKGTPFPTYGGSRYLGGYSDHFPVTAKFLFDKKR